MRISEQDQQVLSALQVAREQHPELAELLDFYGDLYRVQFEAKAEIPEPAARDELAARWRLEGGIPQLTFERLGIEPHAFGVLFGHVEKVLLRHNPSWQASQEAIPVEQLMVWAREVFETWDTLTAPKGALPWTAEEATGHVAVMAVGFSLAPYLQRAAEAILPLLDLNMWYQPYCPICGGRPNLALLQKPEGARHLVCARCNCAWLYRRVGCPFCKSSEKQNYYLSQDHVHRLYVCPKCQQYLKTVDLRELNRPVYPAVERLLTVGMDLAAHGEAARTE
jgi:FdhE protein